MNAPFPSDTGKLNGAITNIRRIRHRLRAGLKLNRITKKLTIRRLRPGPGDRLDVVLADKDEANEAKQHPRWLMSSIRGTRIKAEQWYPVKFDSVV